MLNQISFSISECALFSEKLLALPNIAEAKSTVCKSELSRKIENTVNLNLATRNWDHQEKCKYKDWRQI
jgi:hypothetical protein